MQYNKVRPRSRTESMKWNYYNSDSWDFIKIRYWPWDIARAVISGELNYVMRFRWYLYLVGNGMDPGIARDVVKGELSHSKDKQMHIDALYRDLKKNAKKWSYWDEHLKKTMKIDDTLVIDDNDKSYIPPIVRDYSLKADIERRRIAEGRTKSVFDLNDEIDISDADDF